MGGCKCTFRKCPVTTQKFPDMHFFYYPLKKVERSREWIKNSNYLKINEMLPSQAKNRVVCALHFRDECFMNYKKDRLTPVAVPTLDRLKNGAVIDYTKSEAENPITLSPTKDKHLIPPEGFLVCGYPKEFWDTFPTAINVQLQNKHNINNSSKEPRPKKRRMDDALNVPSQEPRILNQELLFSSSPSNGFDYNGSTTITLTDDEIFQRNGAGEEDENYESIDLNEQNSSHVSNESTTVVLNKNGFTNRDEVEFIAEESIEPIEEVDYIIEISALKTELETIQTETSQRINDLEEELTQAKAETRTAEDSYKKAQIRLKEYEKQLEDLKSTNKELLKAKTAEPRSSTPKPATTTLSSSSLTKPQLFNGIKKYISSSMMALLRMEMFGSSERTWKPDEKQVSVELLRLGHQIYDYFRDEWRFRLPPKKLVEEWTNEEAEEDGEDM